MRLSRRHLGRRVSQIGHVQLRRGGGGGGGAAAGVGGAVAACKHFILCEFL